MCEFQGAVDHFIGIEFTNVTHPDGNILIFLNQSAFIKHISTESGLVGLNVNFVTTPHFPEYPVDTIPCKNMPLIQCSNIASNARTEGRTSGW